MSEHKNFKKLEEFINQNHKNIAGWFFPLDHLLFVEIFNIQKNLNNFGNLIEVGVYQGKSLILMSLLRTSDEHLFGFDLFENNDLIITQDNLRKFGDDANTKLVRGLTSDIEYSELVRTIPKSARFIHIDAGHEFHEVIEQMQIFVPFGNDDAVIAMDDYQDREFPGVGAAVLEFAENCKPRRFIPFLVGANKMYLCQAHMASRYQLQLIKSKLLYDKCRLSRVKDFNVLIAASKLPVPTRDLEKQLQEFDFPRLEMKSGTKNSEKYSQIKFGSGN